MSNNKRDLFIKKMKAVGQELIDNAESIVGDCNMPLTSISIYANIESNNEDYTIPTIDVTHNYISDAQYLVDFDNLIDKKRLKKEDEERQIMFDMVMEKDNESFTKEETE